MGRRNTPSLITVVLLVLSLGAFTQENPPKPKVSNDPLTTEQIEVYRAVLRDFLNGSDGPLNLANVTEPLDTRVLGCFKGMDVGVTKEAVSVLHRLGPSLVADTKIVLVDPERQQQVDPSVKNTAVYIFGLSEIAFDKQHLRAVVAYSFTCGRLCGYGTTLLLKKLGHDWKVAKSPNSLCAYWVS
jgi:hypothetical protein